MGLPKRAETRDDVRFVNCTAYDYQWEPGEFEPVRFRQRTILGVLFLMACCLTAAFLLYHFNHA